MTDNRQGSVALEFTESLPGWIAATRSSCDKVYKLPVSATHHSTNYWRILPAFMLCLRERLVHSSRTKQECLISRILLLSMPLTATSILGLGETKKLNAQSQPTSIQRDSSRKLPAIYLCTPKKTKYITTKNTKAVLDKLGKQNLTIAFAASDLNILCLSFKEAGPQIFQEGDIVELQVSFIVVPVRDQKFRMSIVLRGVTLLEGIFTQVSAVLKTTRCDVVDANILTRMHLWRRPSQRNLFRRNKSLISLH